MPHELRIEKAVLAPDGRGGSRGSWLRWLEASEARFGSIENVPVGVWWNEKTGWEDRRRFSLADRRAQLRRAEGGLNVLPELPTVPGRRRTEQSSRNPADCRLRQLRAEIEVEGDAAARAREAGERLWPALLDAHYARAREATARDLAAAAAFLRPVGAARVEALTP